jgi:hypothetical protein
MGSPVKLLVFSFLIIFFPQGQYVLAGEIVINELMASNATTIADEDGDFEDWIEIFNYGNDPVNLEGYGLSDNYENPFKWIFPSIIIEPGEFLLIWASGKDRRDKEHLLHTNFSISSDGEEILLTRPDGERLDEIPPTSIPTDISYGRQPDGGKGLFFFNSPTPGWSNISDYFKGILDKVTLSHSPGFYSDDFLLELLNPEPETTIYYTLDGSNPDTTSLLFKGPVPISDRSDDENQHSMIPTNFLSDGRGWIEPAGKIAKATMIRAISFKDGYMPGPVVSATYFVFPEGESRYSLDIISIITEHHHLFSDSIGIYVPGDTYVEGNDNTGNYVQREDEWERPASIEFFEDVLIFQQDIGIRIHGGFSRRFPQKSLRLYARSDYGESRFNYPIFPDFPYGSYNRLILRNSGNDYGYTMFRDAAAQSLIRHFDVDNQAYRPTVTFINGEYWGIKNLRERYDKYYLERVYGINPDNIDLLTGRNSVQEGDNIHYNQMIDFMVSTDLGANTNFSEVEKMMDINNFIDYYSAQIYFANNDWPHSNIDFWRFRTDYDQDAPKGHDGRWRWLLYDVDRSLGYFTDFRFDMIKWLTGPLNGRNNQEWPNIILRNLLDNENFKKRFINRIADHLNTAFLPSRVHHVLDSLKAKIDPEISEHIHRWGQPVSKSWWNSNVQVMYTNASSRPAYVRQHIKDHFDIEGLINLILKTDDPEQGYIRVNTINIHPSTPGVPDDPYPWTGIYFHGIPIEVEAVANEGYAFSHWVGNENQMDQVLNITPEGDISLKAYFVKEEVPEVVSYWFFGTDLPNNTPLDTIMPVFARTGKPFLEFQSAFEGYPFDSEHENWRKASLERRNAPTEINYHTGANDDIPFEDSGMRGIQVKQPLEHQGRRSELIFHVPSTGYREPVFRFAAMDEGAAERLVINYSVSGGEPQWTSSGPDNTTIDLSDSYQLYEIDLFSVEEAENNPDLKIRIRFEGADMTADEGNRVTFSNFSLHGIPLNYNFFSKPAGSVNELSSWGAVPDGSGEQPPSFGLHTAKFHIRNRERAELNSPWEVTGIDSRVIAGDDINELMFEVNAVLDATIDVMSDATLHLYNSIIPDPGELRDGSTVIFSGEAATIPYHSYFNLTLDGTDPLFEGDGTLSIRGDLELREIDEIGSLVFDGSRMQNIVTTGLLKTGNLTISNTENLTLRGIVEVAGNLHFENGKILAGENSLVKLGTEGYATGYDFEKFVDGPVGIYRDNTTPEKIVFPTGKGDYFNPLTLEINHNNDNRVLYIAELFSGAPPQFGLPAGLTGVFGDFYFSLGISGDYHISSAFASMHFDPKSITVDPDLLRIAKSADGRWTNIGGTISENIISSTLSFNSPGILALAEQALEIDITASAGAGGTIDPEGTHTVYQGSDKTFAISAGQGYHIKNIFIDGDSLAGAPGNFAYSYTFRNIIDSRTIHAEFDLNNYQEVDVFPNPATERLWVRFRQNIEYIAVITLITIDGKAVAEKTLSPGDNTSGYINLQGTDPGVYILKIEYGGHKINRKILIL